MFGASTSVLARCGCGRARILPFDCATSAGRLPWPTRLFDDVPRAPYGYHLKFCTAPSRMQGNFGARFRRRAEVTLRPYETVSEDDTIQFGGDSRIHPMSRRTSEELIQELGSTQNGCGMMTWRTGSSSLLDIAESIAPMLEVPIVARRCTRPMSAGRSAWSGSMNIGQDARRHLQTDDHGP